MKTLWALGHARFEQVEIAVATTLKRFSSVSEFESVSVLLGPFISVPEGASSATEHFAICLS